MGVSCETFQFFPLKYSTVSCVEKWCSDFHSWDWDICFRCHEWLWKIYNYHNNPKKQPPEILKYCDLIFVPSYSEKEGGDWLQWFNARNIFTLDSIRILINFCSYHKRARIFANMVQGKSNPIESVLQAIRKREKNNKLSKYEQRTFALTRKRMKMKWGGWACVSVCVCAKYKSIFPFQVDFSPGNYARNNLKIHFQTHQINESILNGNRHML